MAGQLGLWSITDRLAEISAPGDPLETLATTVDFEMFRPVLEGALGRPPRRADAGKLGRWRRRGMTASTAGGLIGS